MSESKEKDSWIPRAEKPCDRCNRDIKKINSSITKNNTFIQLNNEKNQWFDLCDDCKEDLKEFLEIGGEKQ